MRSHLKKVENQLEGVLKEKTKIEKKLASSTIYESKNKTQLLEALNQQTELSNEEKVLTKEWDKLSFEIEHYKTEGIFKN